MNNGCHLSRTDAHHVFVVEGLVVHVAGTVLFLQAANAVLESGGAGERPGTGERLGLTLVRHKTDGIGREFDRNSRNVLHLGNAPRFRAVREVAIGKNDHGNHVFQSDAGGFQGNPEAVTGSSCGQHRDGRLGVTTEKSLEKVGLLGFCGQAGGGTATLDVANHHGDFGHDCKPKGFRFQGHTRTGSGGNGQ